MSEAADSLRNRDWVKENESSEFIPYKLMINKNTVKLYSGDFLQVFRVEGVAHESADDEDIVMWKDQLNMMLRSIASNKISITTHVVRREKGKFPGGVFGHDFDKNFNEKYQTNLRQKKMMVNELYFSVVYRPQAINLSILQNKKNKIAIKKANNKAITELNEVTGFIKSALQHYKGSLLSTYIHNDILHSEVLEFLDFLVNGDYTPRLLPKTPIRDCLTRNRLFFAKEAFEVRGLVESKVGASEGTEAGLMNSLLSAPFEFILCQSFNFLSKPIAVELLQRQKGRMETTEDLAVSQIEEIDDALNDLVSNKFVFGQHHLSLVIFAENTDQLKINLSDAKNELANSSMVIVREDLALMAAYYAMLPGNAKYRPRPSAITSLNFAGFSSLHNYPQGHRTGNQWGDAVTMFKTTSGAPYYFNFHEPLDSRKAKKIKELVREHGSDALKEEKEEQKALGNTLIVGPSGSGKTVLQGFLMSQSKKFNATQIIFDKDRGLEIFVRVSGGVYSPILTGESTGFNPFQMDKSESNILFLTSFIKKCCGGQFTNTQDKEIDQAIRGVMDLPKGIRRISRCLDFLNPTGENGAYERLSKWCNGESLSWVFDNEEDTLDFENNTMFGFDVTEFLDNEEIRTPLIMYLYHRVEQLIDGRRVMVFLDEFWKLLLDKYFEDFAQNKQKVFRKQNGIMVYGTQSAKDVLRSPIAHTLIEQCATMILMPNPKAKEEDYINGLNLTAREFEIVKNEMQPSSRSFLVKQGHNSVVAILDLAGFDDELAIISGTTENVLILERVIKEHGKDVNTWLPLFHKERKK